MFTGLIEEIGRLVRFDSQGASARLEIEAPRMAPELVVGESVAVDGACLTVETPTPRGFIAFVSSETLERTTLGEKVEPARAVNLERALRVGDRLGGHLVSGHIDATGVVTSIEPRAGGWWLRVAAPTEILEVSVSKGSIAVDGVSLTLVDVTARDFTVAVIPETFRATTFGLKKTGDPVNLESDAIGKYVARALAIHRDGSTHAPLAATPLDLLLRRSESKERKPEK